MLPVNTPTIFKSKEDALAAADTKNPNSYYGKDACRKLTCQECGAIYYGYTGSYRSEDPYCDCGVNDMWTEKIIK